MGLHFEIVNANVVTSKATNQTTRKIKVQHDANEQALAIKRCTTNKTNRLNTLQTNKRLQLRKKHRQQNNRYINKLKTASMPDSILVMNVCCRFLLIEWANL